MSLLGTLEARAEAFWTGISAEEKALVTTLKPILTGAIGQFMQTMLPTAESIVLDLATSGKTSNEKRNEAVSQLQTAATAAGLSVASSVLNLAVEAAYNNLGERAGSPAAPVAPSVPAPAGSNDANAPVK